VKPEPFDLEIELLSPLHIGDGNTLIPMEYVLEGSVLRIVNLDFLVNILKPEYLERLGDEMQPLDVFLQNIGQGHILRKPELYLREMRLLGMARTYLAKDLKQGERKQPPAGRYQGRHGRRPDDSRGRDTINKAQIKTFVKTREKPFIPGSSVKGAFRTALAYDILQKAGSDVKQKILDSSYKKIMGKDGREKFVPDEHDAVEKYLLRAGDGIDEDVMALVGFSDSEPIDPGSLVIVRGQRINGPLTTYYEALPSGVKSTISVFSNRVKREKNENLIPRSPDEFLQITRNFAEALVNFETEHVRKMRDRDQRSSRSPGKNATDLDRIVKFYQALETKMNQNPDAGFMALGWGTGWHGKTVGLLLKDNPGFKDVMFAYRMGGRRKEPQDFPVSREVILGQDIEPLFGWVMLRRV